MARDERFKKRTFQGDLSRLRRSRSAASRPNKARSARQEVDLLQVYQEFKVSQLYSFCQTSF